MRAELTRTFSTALPEVHRQGHFGLDSNGEPISSSNSAQPTAAPAEPEGASPTVAAPAPVSEQLGDRIGRYKLLQHLGVGGMGSVWVAEQTEPVRRTVALKVISRHGLGRGLAGSKPSGRPWP